MMYQNKFVVAIKANGKVLRETKDIVQLPFGSEFSVLVKNLNSRRAKFSLHIDGTNVLDGTDIIVDANSEVEMKRFIRNGNMNEGNAFKFIERTAAIEDGPRGIKVDDGVVRVEFTFEEEAPVYTTTYHRDIWWDRSYPYSRRMGSDGWLGSVTGSLDASYSTGSARVTKSASKGITASTANAGIAADYTSHVASEGAAVAQSAPVNDVGITVPGSKVDQKFTPVYGFKPEAQSHVIVLRLSGVSGEVQVVAPVTVKAKQKCETCGHMNKATAKYCSDCGTALELL